MRYIVDIKRKSSIIIIAHRLATVEGRDALFRIKKGYTLKSGKPETILRENRCEMDKDKE